MLVYSGKDLRISWEELGSVWGNFTSHFFSSRMDTFFKIMMGFYWPL